MSLKKTKEQLIQLLGQTDNSVIALSGKWGTGKTHLWNEVKAGSADEKVNNALYVSLFGMSSIDQLKRKLIETAIPGGNQRYRSGFLLNHGGGNADAKKRNPLRYL